MSGRQEREDQDAIAFSGVSKSFFNNHNGEARLSVVDNISFHAAPGAFVVILGPSGCGKSTILNIMAGFEAPSAGQVTAFGVRVEGPSSERGMVFQEDSLFPWLTVRDNILFGLKCRNVKPLPDVSEYLAAVNLEGVEQFLPHELSGGMKQRVALARVLINHPRLLLMDEPFGALDAQTREDMQELFASVHARYRPTVVFVTHDVEEAVYLADRILILSRRPARVTADIPVPVSLPRPPSWREDDLFHKIVAGVRREFRKGS